MGLDNCLDHSFLCYTKQTKTKRKNRKLRNKKRTRKIYQKGGGLGSNVKKYVKHTKRNHAIWNDPVELFKPLNEAFRSL